MKKPAGCWLAALLAAAMAASAPPRVDAEETGPEKATKTQAAEPAKPPPGTKSAKRDTYPFHGIVASFDDTSSALTLEGKGTKRVVHLTAQTRLTKLGHPAVAEALKAGEEVGGTLRRVDNGREEAVLIRIGPKSGDPDPVADGKKSGRPKKSKEAAE